MKYIIDEEIDLEEKDYLNSKKYSIALKEIIDSAPNNKVFTIGLFGGWGTGKSSIIKTTENLYTNTEAVKFIKYDAWQYVNDSFRRMFLRILQEQLKYKESDYMKKFYENKTRDLKVNHKISIFNIISLFAAIILSILILNKQNFDVGAKIGTISAWSLLLTLLNINTKIHDSLKVSITEPMVFAPEQFTDCFNEIVDWFFNKEALIDKFRYIIAKFTKEEFHGTKLIIVIDNIDRCQNEVAYSLLSDIKTFLGNQDKNIVFIIPVDDIELKKQIFNKTKDSNDNKENEEFLRKSFNTVLRIKPFVETDMYIFAKKIAEQNDLQFSDDIIYLASKKYSKNPRRIVQLYNNLLSEFSFYQDPEFIKKNQALICICVIIREEYFEFYKLLINTPLLLKDQTLANSDEKEKIIKKAEDFLLISKTIIQKFDISVIEKIINNNDSYYAGIPGDIKDSITTFNSENFLSLLKTNSSIEKDVYSYLIDNRVVSAVRNRNKNEICNLFNFIAEINDKEELIGYLQNIDGQFIQYGYKNIIVDTTNRDAVCKFIEYLADKGFNTAKKDLIKIVSNFGNEKSNVDKELFDATLEYCNDLESTKQLVKSFDLIYGESGTPAKLNQDQFDTLVTEEFIDKRIQKISNKLQMDNNLLFLCTIFSKKRNYTQNSQNKFFESITKIMSSNNNKSFEVLHEEMIIVLQILKFFIKNYESYKNAYSNNNYLQTIYGYFFNPRSVNGSQRIYLNEIINNELFINDSIELLKSIYILSKESFPMTREYNTLKTNKSEILLKAYYDLVNVYEMTLFGIANRVLDIITSINSLEAFYLYKHFCFRTNESSGYVVQLDKISSKFNLLYDFSNLKEEKQKLITELCDDTHYSETITDSLIAKGDEFINNLPSEILSKIKKVFREDTKDKYKKNYVLLAIIASKGTKEQKRILKNMIINNIHDHSEIKESLNLIEEGEFDKSIQDEFTSTLKSYLEEVPGIDEELKKRIENIIDE